MEENKGGKKKTTENSIPTILGIEEYPDEKEC